MDGNERWGKGILLYRLLLFLGSLGAMILLAGLLFSKSDNTIRTAQAGEQKSAQAETLKAAPNDSLPESSNGTSIPTKLKP